MKKSKKVLATLALSTTLALVAVPAFAADASVNDSGSFATDGKGVTQLNVQATASQIQATLPIDITVVTPAAGGTITAPSANAYKITNNNAEAPLLVKKIQGVDANGWVFKSALSQSADIASGTTGEMKLSVKAGASAAVAITTTDTEIPAGTAAYFTVPANDSLGLTLEGATAVKTSLPTDSPIKAAKIQYTVGVATA